MRSDDPGLVAAQYATEAGLEARASVYGGGFDARDVVVARLRAVCPASVLEVGCGWGELAARITRETGADVTAIDLSPRMVELARERGVDARVGDVQELPFEGGSFDAVVAAWMLYHVPDLDGAIAEVARVLRPGGIAVAVTNGARDLAELWALVGRDLAERPLTFRAENGARHLAAHFARVERVDLEGAVVFADADAIRSYVGSSISGSALVDRVPALMEPLVATKRVTVFVASAIV